jgi:DNA ligase 1
VQRAQSVKLGSENILDQIQELSKAAQLAGVEGLVIKGLDSFYETSGKRVNTWLKLKNMALTNGMRDTLDLVPIGGFYGKGNRTGVLGSYLMASYNGHSGQFESICKLGTGFSFEQLKSIKVNRLCEDPDQAASLAMSLYKCSSF